MPLSSLSVILTALESKVGFSSPSCLLPQEIIVKVDVIKIKSLKTFIVWLFFNDAALF
jgi:hypothetical protein